MPRHVYIVSNLSRTKISKICMQAHVRAYTCRKGEILVKYFTVDTQNGKISKKRKDLPLKFGRMPIRRVSRNFIS